MADQAFWFVQRHFIVLLACVGVTTLATALIDTRLAQVVPAIYFAALSALIVLRSATGRAARIGFGFGGVVIGIMVLAVLAR